ncbi:hypothetical protein Dimus_005530, partial [Dionaea muscipula]
RRLGFGERLLESLVAFFLGGGRFPWWSSTGGRLAPGHLMEAASGSTRSGDGTRWEARQWLGVVLS